jgi:uncharacterized protein YkwD
LPAATLIAAGLLAALIATPRGNTGEADVAATPSGATFARDLQLLGFAEAVDNARFLAALEKIAALQKLAALAQWPEPYVAPSGPAPPAVPLTPRPATRAAPWTDAAFAAAVLEALNARRAAVGLPSLSFDGRIAQASSSYALRMISLDSFGHSVDGSTITSRLSAAGFTDPVMLGEVLAWSTGTPSAASVVQMWMDSPPHREQILSANYRIAGAGCAFDGGKVQCVVDLAG